MFLTYPLRRETLPATIRSAIYHFCYPSNCSKFLLMKLVWASFYCSANWESYASAISALLSTSRSPRSPTTWHCCVKAGYCWTASKVSGFITAYHRIFQHGRRKLLMRPGDVNRKRFRRLSATWLDKTVPGTVRTFAVKNLAKHI